MKKLISIILVMALALSVLAACGSSKEEKTADKKADKTDDSSEITMFVGLGNDQTYYEKLQQAVKDELGYNIKFIYKRPEDTTNALNMEFKNNDLCADIICTASRATEDEWLYDSCIDYLSSGNLTSKFSYAKVKECTCDDGCVYQLPFTSKLIGITYNKTLMEEMGWEVPSNFDEMVELKKKCDKEGIPFAVCEGLATGHGFNWLFHTMGAQWISTLKGTQWIEGFTEGTESIDAFAEQAKYFKKYKEAGLFGDFYADEWDGGPEFSKKRALFLYSLTNVTTSYDGPQYDAKGKKIKGSELHDVYATMPWITENGKNNCFTYYDNMYIALNKNLEEDEDKLDKVLEILEFMTTDKATALFTDVNPDGYVALEKYTPSEKALYIDYSKEIAEGFLQPWYYSYFDPDTIVKTGEAVNSYLSNKGASFEDIMNALDEANADNVNKNNPVFGEVKRTLSYKELAEFEAVCQGQGLQKKLDDAGEKAKVQVSLMPYIEKEEDMTPWQDLSLINTKLYGGTFEEAYIGTILVQSAKSPQAVYMKGAAIKKLVDAGYQGKYPIAMMTRGKIELEDDKTYLTAINYSTFAEGQYEAYLEKDQVLLPGDVEAIESPGEGLLADAIKAYFAENGSLDIDALEWK